MRNIALPHQLEDPVIDLGAQARSNDAERGAGHSDQARARLQLVAITEAD